MAKQQYDYDKMIPHEVWQLVYGGKLKQFPNGYFKTALCDERIIEIVKYIVEVYYGWNKEELLNNLNMKLIKDLKLNGLFFIRFNNIYDFINLVYPNICHPWELKRAPQGIWNDEEIVVEAIKWLIEDKLKWSKEDIKKNFNQHTLRDNGLQGLLTGSIIKGSPYKCLCITYGEDFLKPWELQNTGSDYWNLETAKLPIYWLVEEKGWTKETLVNLTLNQIKDYGFISPYSIFFHENLIAMLNNAYPNEYKKVGSAYYHIPSGYKRETLYSSNSSGKSGISFNANKNKWSVHINKDGKTIYVGDFDNKDEAIKCRLDYEQQQLQ